MQRSINATPQRIYREDANRIGSHPTLLEILVVKSSPAPGPEIQKSSIPALKKKSDWCLDARQKADIFADTFERKNVMIKEEVNEYLEIEIIREAPVQAGLPTIETTEKI